MDKYNSSGEKIFSVCTFFPNCMDVYLLYKMLHICNAIHFNEFGHIHTPTTLFTQKNSLQFWSGGHPKVHSDSLRGR